MSQPFWKDGLTRIFTWISKLAYINLLWIAFTLMGLIFLGIFPSTVAMFTVLRKWMTENVDVPVFKTFWYRYRESFLETNGIGFLFMVMGYILYADLTVFEFDDSLLDRLHQIAIIIITIFFGFAISFFFPLYAQYKLKWFQYIQLAFLTGVSSPFRAALMWLLAYGAFFVMTKFPGLLLFFFGSFVAYLWIMIAIPLFAKLEHKGLTTTD